MLLKTTGLTKIFGGLVAVHDVDLTVDAGQIVGLIGPNGAGKSTIINLISGFLRPTRGQIDFDGRNITALKPHQVARLGIGRTFQIIPFFGQFTALENIVASFYLSADTGLWGPIFNTRAYRRREKDIWRQAEEHLQLVGLGGVRDELAKNLPHGYQRVLDLANALAVKPKLLLLDEPLGGMDSEEISLALKVINKIRSQGTTILLIEHNVAIVMSLCDRIVVVNYGRKIAEGPPGEVRKNKEVIRAYFGGDHAA
ncbi:MAG: ABC transporter ATP-binding protein [Deltaproteobacteria bacterium]|nr:ABC transporter ATP-binding protein [Deltaproteobacteria bacterium]